MAKNPAGEPPKRKQGWAQAGPGRPKGSKNRATTECRAIITMIADGLAEDAMSWLVQTANGIPVKGKPGQWLVKPEPSKAMDLYLKAIEYHIPKLSRTEVSGPNGGDIPTSITISHVKSASTGS